LLATCSAGAAEPPATVIVTTTPLPGFGVPVDEVPGNVQTYSAADLGHQHPASLPDFFEQNAGSVSLNSGQGNPFQQDLVFRGFTASPVLGTPQGLSVFQDGVRINEPFGDVVNFDLIPEAAIAGVELIPGSNPAFGLNTLGGALAFATKNGSDFPGLAVDAGAGSFDRRRLTAEYGGRREALDLYLCGNYTADGGWARHNSSRLAQFFAKAGVHGERGDGTFSVTLADDHLDGAQTLPTSLLFDPRQPYTYPDRNTNRLVFLIASGKHRFGDTLLLGANTYYRQLRNANLSSNVNGDYGVPDRVTGLPSTLEANLASATVAEQGYGAGLQLSSDDQVFGRAATFVLGASADLAHTRFDQWLAPAIFAGDRNTIPLGPFQATTAASSQNADYALFAEHTLALTPTLRWSLSGRYERVRTALLDDSGRQPLLNGAHAAARFNGALGLVYTAAPGRSLYAAVSQGMRVPTPIELACADPTAPCSLPNDFLSDPALAPVLSRTVELGVRAHLQQRLSASFALFRTDLRQDIAFVGTSGSALNAGYFRNVGDTRREGLELQLREESRPLAASVSLAYVAATYRSAFVEASPSNSSANASGTIAVQPGERLPGIPALVAKLRLDYRPHERTRFGVGLVGDGASYARGDENNADRHGRLPGYVVLNLDGSWQLTATLELYVRIDNALDRAYANFALLSHDYFAGPGHGFDGTSPPAEQFRGLGTPRAVWLGLRYGTP
jgi:outer membrane receptor protein involved in Fe transport